MGLLKEVAAILLIGFIVQSYGTETSVQVTQDDAVKHSEDLSLEETSAPKPKPSLSKLEKKANSTGLDPLTDDELIHLLLERRRRLIQPITLYVTNNRFGTGRSNNGQQQIPIYAAYRVVRPTFIFQAVPAPKRQQAPVYNTYNQPWIPVQRLNDRIPIYERHNSDGTRVIILESSKNRAPAATAAPVRTYPTVQQYLQPTIPQKINNNPAVQQYLQQTIPEKINNPAVQQYLQQTIPEKQYLQQTIPEKINDNPPLQQYLQPTIPHKVNDKMLPVERKKTVTKFPGFAPLRNRGVVSRIGANAGSVPGRPGVDFPNYGEIPHTTFSCQTQRYKGFFGDPKTNCQVWHYCDLNGGQASFLCPNGTIFNQVLLTCDWWFNVKCDSTLQGYVLNERLYKYIMPLVPSFPEDYQGPLVDSFLAQKYQELKHKEQKDKGKKKNNSGKLFEEELDALQQRLRSIDHELEDVN